METPKFPKTFFWGSGTSAHQVEGSTYNDWSEWEHEHAKRLAEGAQQRYGHLASWERIKLQATNPLNYISGQAADHYHRFEEDFTTAKSLGHNAHRFSIEWSRIEPHEGKFDEAAIEHYRQVIAALRERNLEPFVCLWHWTIPVWLRDKGGVESGEFGKYFARYVHVIAGSLKNDVRYWLTLNEPTSVIGHSYFNGHWPPQKKSWRAALRVYHVLADAHARAYKVLHALDPDAQVGFTNIMAFIEPARDTLLDRLAARIRDFVSNQYFLKLTGTNTHDFYALQYYFHWRLRFPGKPDNENKLVNDMGWEVYQEGLYHLLKRLSVYKKPIYITENGIADARDTYRARFLEDAVFWMKKAMAEGVDLRGYFHWSLLDNFEWSDGLWPRFGLVEVDYTNQQRKIRPSAFAYKKIIEDETQK